MMHELTSMLNRIGYVRSSQSEIVKRPNNLSIQGWIGEGSTNMEGETRARRRQSRGWFTVKHGGVLEERINVLRLSQENTSQFIVNLNAN